MNTPPPTLELRPYQQSIIDVTIEHFRKSDEPIIIDACVGAGKTLVISHIARHVVNKSGRVISLAHTKELVESAYYTFMDYAQDMACGVFSAGMGRKDTEHDVTFCSEKSLACHLIQQVTFTICWNMGLSGMVQPSRFLSVKLTAH